MDTRITTGEAAEIVHVHESTVKRWCDVGDVEAVLTQGGHRRISLRSLLEHASEKGLKSGLLAFRGDAERAYEALSDARESDFSRVSRMIRRGVRDDDSPAVARLLVYLIQNRIAAADVFDRGVAPTLRDIGRRWARGELSVGEEHRMSAVMSDALHGVRDAVRPEGRSGRRALVGSLAGNRHDMAANMVRITLEAEGWTVTYLGGDVPTQDFAFQQERTRSELVCMSVTSPQVSADAVRAARVLAELYRPEFAYRLAVGGGPVRRLSREDLRDLPFEDARSFRTLSSFAQWL